MPYILLRLYGCLLLASLPLAASSQTAVWLGGELMGGGYFGDLTHQEGSQSAGAGGGMRVMLLNDKLISPTIRLQLGAFQADNRQLAQTDGAPNTYVETSYLLLSVGGMIRPWQDKALQPYGLLGIGLLGYTPKDAAGTKLEDQSLTRNLGEAYSPSSLALPIGLGLTYQLDARWMAYGELNYVLAFTDYLDNVGELGPANGNDALWSLSLGLAYKLR